MTADLLRIELVEKSFEKVRENKDSFALTFYDQLFIESPQLKYLFENTDIPKQSEKLYGSLVSKNSYCIVFDTIISEMAPDFSNNRPWNRGNSPKTAINKFLKMDDKFIVDNSIDNKLLISMAPGGFLKKVK